MVNSSKIFDLVLLGANAFTGKLAADYVARNFPPSVRWAISGRNSDKLRKLNEKLSILPNPPQAFFVLNHEDKKEVFDLIQKAQVALSFAGPFSRYGENVVAACAQFGTHYLDITGETPWVQEMIKKYEVTATRSGAILIPFSGFDSIPSDLGVWQTLRKAQTQSSDPITEIVSLFSVRGGINGGTFATFLEGLEKGSSRNPYGNTAALVPAPYQKNFIFPEQIWPRFLNARSVTAPPFFMAPINSRVVYRSQALRMKNTQEKNPAFRYTELQSTARPFTRARSWMITLGEKALHQIGSFSMGRKILKQLGPKVGEGPSPKIQNHGFFKAQFFAYRRNQLVTQTEIYFRGDPGNKATITMACESARCLISDHEQIKDLEGGFWTPSTALGSLLRNRLAQAGMEFKD